MKLSIDCECILTQKALELFLKDYICDEKEAQFIVSDSNKKYEKPVFLVGKNSPYLQIPFSKEKLLDVLQEYCFVSQNGKILKKDVVRQETLEFKISKLIDSFKDDLLKIISEENAK